MNPRVKYIKYQNNYKFEITFLNNEVKLFDISPYLNYPIYEELKDENFCKKATVFSGTRWWNEIIDFAPDRLYLESK